MTGTRFHRRLLGTTLKFTKSDSRRRWSLRLPRILGPIRGGLSESDGPPIEVDMDKRSCLALWEASKNWCLKRDTQKDLTLIRKLAVRIQNYAANRHLSDSGRHLLASELIASQPSSVWEASKYWCPKRDTQKGFDFDREVGWDSASLAMRIQNHAANWHLSGSARHPPAGRKTSQRW